MSTETVTSDLPSYDDDIGSILSKDFDEFIEVLGVNGIGEEISTVCHEVSNYSQSKDSNSKIIFLTRHPWE